MTTIEILTVILYALGAAQGAIFGGVLLFGGGPNDRANRWLAGLLFLLAYRLTVQIMRLFGLGYYDTWYYFMLDMSWVVGPLLFFYVRALVRPDHNWKRSDYLHFVPLLIQMGFSLFVRIQNLYWDGTRESLSWLGYWGYVVWMNHPTIYVIASISIMYYAWRSQRLLKEKKEGILIDPDRVKWISRITRAFQWSFALVFGILLVDLLVYKIFLGNDYWYFTRYYYYPFFGGLSVLTYWLGIEGLRRKDDQGLRKKPVLSTERRHQMNELAERLDQIMREQKPFQQPDLNLQQLADMLGVKPYLLSNCLRDQFGQKFSGYINALRIQEVERMLQTNDYEHFTLLGLGLEAGFNSKSSFHRAVKRQRGVSPGELRAAVRR
ncbi:MAG: helix-turn-helix transcriptional regulator [Bacteroidota bacterium]